MSAASTTDRTCSKEQDYDQEFNKLKALKQSIIMNVNESLINSRHKLILDDKVDNQTLSIKIFNMFIYDDVLSILIEIINDNLFSLINFIILIQELMREILLEKFSMRFNSYILFRANNIQKVLLDYTLDMTPESRIKY